MSDFTESIKRRLQKLNPVQQAAVAEATNNAVEQPGGIDELQAKLRAERLTVTRGSDRAVIIKETLLNLHDVKSSINGGLGDNVAGEVLGNVDGGHGGGIGDMGAEEAAAEQARMADKALRQSKKAMKDKDPGRKPEMGEDL